MKATSIRLFTKTSKRLKRFKKYKKETDDESINRLLNRVGAK